MRDKDKTKKELISELLELRQRVAKLGALETGHKRVDEEIQKEKEYYRSFVESLSDWVWEMNVKGVHTYSNSAVEDILGYKVKEVVGHHITELWVDDAKTSETLKWLQKTLVAGKGWKNFHGKFKHKNGPMIITESTAIPIFDSENKLIGYRGIDRAITEHKQAEESLKKKVLELDSFINNIPDMAWLKDAESRFIALNKAFGDVAGMKPETLIGRTCEVCFGAEAGKKFREDDLKVMNGRKQVSIEEKILDSKGNELWLETIKSSIFDESGKIVGTVGIARNVTERKRIEKALIRKERIAQERARLLTDLRNQHGIDDILTGVCEAIRDSGLFERAVMTLHKPGGKIIHLGQVGLPPDVVERARQAPPMDNELRARITDKRFRISDSFFIPAEAGADFNKTGRYIPQRKRKSGGDWQPGDELFVPLRDFSGKVMGYLSVDTPTDGCRPDVKTIEALEMLVEAAASRIREVEAQEVLKREHDFSQSILETANSLIVCLDADAKIMIFNQECERVTGYRSEEVIGKRWPEMFLLPDPRDAKIKSFAKWVRAHPRDRYERPIKTKSGEIRTILWSNSAILGSNKKELLAFAIGHDITERKRAEEELKETTELLQSVMDNATDEAIITTDQIGGILNWNKGARRLLGYEPEEVVGKESVRIFHTEEYLKSGIMDVNVKKMIATGRPLIEELSYVAKDGKTIPVQQIVNPRFDEDGKFIGMVGMARDITERKRWEQTQSVLFKIANAVNTTKDLDDLFKSIRENLSTILDTTNFYIALYDKKSRTISLPYQVDEKDKFISFPAGETLTSYVIKKNKSLLATEEVKERLVQAGVVETIGTPSKVWLGVPLKTEKETIGAVVVQSYKDASIYNERDLEILKFVSGQIAIAIERKKAQQALQRSEERYRDLVEKEKDIIYTLDTRGSITSVNSAVKAWGYQPEELIGKNFVDIVSKEVREKTVKDFNDLLKKAEITAETVLLGKNGEPHFVEYSSTVIREGGKVVGTRGIVRDITERKRAEEKLRLFSQSVDSSIDGIAMGNLQNRITYVNEAFVRIFGYSKEELIGKEITFIYFEDQIPKLKNALEATMEGGWRGESIGRRKNGQLFPLAVSSSIVMNDEGKTIAQMASHRDITEQKRVEEELKRHRCHLQELVKERTEELRRRDAILEAISFAAEQFLKTTSGYESIQKTLERLGKATGVSRVYIFEKHINEDGTILISQRYEWVASDIVSQMDNPELQNIPLQTKGFVRWEETLSRGSVIHGHIREFPASEREVLASQDIKSIVAVPIFVGQEPWGFIGFDECLTEREWSVAEIDALKAAADILGAAIQRQQSEERLRESEQKYRKTIDSMGDAIHLVDTDLRFVLFNSAFEQWNMELGLETDVRGRTVFEVFPFLPDKVRDEYRRVFDTGKILVTEETITVGDREFITETRKIPVLEKGRIGGVISVIRDITERKRADEQIRQYSERLEELAEKRAARILKLEREQRESEKLAATGRMAARVAHEINNPLGGIKNSFLLIKDAIPEDHPYYKYVGLIEKETERIARIVSQMFDLYRPDQETSCKFSIKETIGNVVALLEVDCRESGIHLEMDTSDVSVVVILPEALVRQVLYNLLQNAIEASQPEGVVRIEARVADEILTITVSDQGCGIPEEIHSQIFEPFFTTKGNLTTGGLGLGLSVSKNLVEAMKGSLDFESKLGQGSLFRITLPVKIV